MRQVPEPIFKKALQKISWKKIYERGYGVQYSEVAVSLLAKAKYHFPKTSTAQIVVPGTGTNTAFFIDSKSWIELVEGLNNKYTASVKKLEAYEKQFLFDGNKYLKIAKKISTSDLKKISDQQLLSLFLDHQDKRNRYSVFAWSAFILNNYVAERATSILDGYIKKFKKEQVKQGYYDSLFAPEKRAAVLELQYQVQKHKGKLSKKTFLDLYNKFKWFSCLDIQNNPWTENEFKEHIKSFKDAPKRPLPFVKVIKEFKFKPKDLEYLLMAKGFVYIKDARDDFRRASVFYSRPLFRELARRMKVQSDDISYLQEQEIVDFLEGKKNHVQNIVQQRKKGFVVYLNSKGVLVCVEGGLIQKALQLFQLPTKEEKPLEIKGVVASQGQAQGKVSIVHGVKDLKKVEVGNILVAITTHPDYVPAMRKASAIVTNEGGVTSHAAIVAREFGIPCIVGTRNAATVLKDGDLIKVDAINGVVIKL